MATVKQLLSSLNRYPIAEQALTSIALRRGITLTEEATTEVVNGKSYRLATADVYMWLSLAPNISQGGQSYSFSEAERKNLRARANALYAEFEDGELAAEVIYGYKGSRL